SWTRFRLQQVKRQAACETGVPPRILDGSTRRRGAIETLRNRAAHGDDLYDRCYRSDAPCVCACAPRYQAISQLYAFHSPLSPSMSDIDSMTMSAPSPG